MPARKYHIALSFAGEDRPYVGAVAESLVSRDIKVFYDAHEEADLWGKNLYTHLSDVYQNQAEFTVMFISKSYAERLWTNHEREGAQARAFEERREYILPARFDDTEVPGVLKTVGYVDLRKKTPVQLADLLVKKLKNAALLEAPSARIQAPAEDAIAVAKPIEDTPPNRDPGEKLDLSGDSNYPSPRLGLLSADTWTLVATYMRNLVLNWRVLIPLLAVVLAVPWIYLAVLMTDPPPYTSLPLWLGVGCIILGVAYMGINLPSGGKAQWGQGKFLWFCLLPLCLGAVFMTIHWAWFTHYGGETPRWPFLPGMKNVNSLSPFIWFGVVVHVLSWMVSLLRIHFRLLEFLAAIASGLIGGILLWVAALKLFPQPLQVAELYVCLAIPLFLGLLIAFARLSDWTGDEEGEWWAGANGWLLILAVAWILVSGLVVFGPFLLGWVISAIAASIAGIVTVLAARSSAIPANGKERGKAGPVALILSKVSSIAAVIFVASLVILAVIVTTWVVRLVGDAVDATWNLDAKSYLMGRKVDYINVLLYAPWWLVIAVVITLAAIGFLMSPRSAPRRRARATRGDDTSKL